MRIIINFDTENDSFFEGRHSEFDNVFDQVQRRVREGKTEGKVIDINGNWIGDFAVEEE